jgi:HAD superfamily hydrolase (TIGR01509 family)
MTMPPPLALLWDVDGTLAETEMEGHRPAFNAAFAAAGLPWRWTVGTYRRLLAVAGGRERMATYLGRMEGRPVSPQRLDDLQAVKQQAYADLVAGGSIGPRAGVARLMEEAARAGLIQGVVTTSSRTAVAALARRCLPHLESCCAFWICGEDVNAKKPAPDAYQLALARLQAMGLGHGNDIGSRVLAIEDSANGLLAAHGAGIGTLVTRSASSAHESLAGFAAALAICDGLGDGHLPARVHRGPACPDGRITLSWLRTLARGANIRS